MGRRYTGIANSGRARISMNLRLISWSAISLMPEGFRKLGDEKLRDLVAFLCSGGDKPREDPKK
jgi:hypothetical protein